SQKLLGDEECNALEILLSGLKLQATASTTIAVCGADLDFQINGISKPIWQTHHIKQNDILSFHKRRSGMRAYLAVKGGFNVKKYEESYSTTLKENKGKKLEVGDTLSFTPSQSTQTTRVPKMYIPNYPTHLTLRIILSYQHSYFTEEQKKKFFNSNYTLTPDMNRMGYKLQGDPMIPSKGGIISEGITFGAVQIPPDGQPIVLLKERQTIGGYPKIGSLLPSDCFVLAQMAIGSTVSFEVIGVEKAQVIMKEFYNFFVPVLTS
ncbi:MAG: biotin-dependent carboxyltransferase family protein, partial [Campylobacterota bacterium]